MKWILLSLIALVIFVECSTAQNSPQGIPYQAVVRNEFGDIVINANVNVRISLLMGSANGTVEFSEEHSRMTNGFGLLNCIIGQGVPLINSFSAVDWTQTVKFMHIEVDLGSGYLDMGTQQLMSVPFALYAANGQVGPQGPAGPTGPQGPAGMDGAAGAIGPQGEQGSMGLTGPAGPAGATGQQGPIGLTGPAGPQGEQGIQGEIGPPGQSAYQLWMEQGNQGTEQDFLESISGVDNADFDISQLGNFSGFSLVDVHINGDESVLVLLGYANEERICFGQSIQAGNSALIKINAQNDLLWICQIQGDVQNGNQSKKIEVDETNNIVYLVSGSRLNKIDSNGQVVHTKIFSGFDKACISLANENLIFINAWISQDVPQRSMRLYTLDSNLVTINEVLVSNNGYALGTTYLNMVTSQDKVFLTYAASVNMIVQSYDQNLQQIWSLGSGCNGTSVPCITNKSYLFYDAINYRLLIDGPVQINQVAYRWCTLNPNTGGILQSSTNNVWGGLELPDGVIQNSVTGEIFVLDDKVLYKPYGSTGSSLSPVSIGQVTSNSGFIRMNQMNKGVFVCMLQANESASFFGISFPIVDFDSRLAIFRF